MLDDDVYFLGHRRREGYGPEAFALGLLQGPAYSSDDILTINNINILNGLFYHNLSPEGFSNETDMQQYLKGVFDTIYTLNYLEGQSILKHKDDATLQKSFGKVFTQQSSATATGTTIGGISANNDWPTAETFMDLIDKDLIFLRNSGPYKYLPTSYTRNSYIYVSLFSPLYAAVENLVGPANPLIFREMAFVLWAEKGYHDGFLPISSRLHLSKTESEF